MRQSLHGGKVAQGRPRVAVPQRRVQTQAGGAAARGESGPVGGMRGIAWIAAAWLALAGCSSPDDVKKQQPPALPQQASEVFQVKLDTSKGAIVIEVHKDWAPIGVDRLYALVKTGYYDGNRFFRVTRAYAQFGINGDHQTNGLWSTAYLPDDRVKQSNVKGAMT